MRPLTLASYLWLAIFVKIYIKIARVKRRQKMKASIIFILFGFALVFVVCGMSMFPDTAASQNLPVQVEALRGVTWIGAECCNWQFTWTKKSGPFFRASWRNSNGQQLTDDNIVINILDNTVEIVRGGGSSSGGCTYRGNIRVGAADGEYWCAGRYAGRWSATIRAN